MYGTTAADLEELKVEAEEAEAEVAQRKKTRIVKKRVTVWRKKGSDEGKGVAVKIEGDEVASGLRQDEQAVAKVKHEAREGVEEQENDMEEVEVEMEVEEEVSEDDEKVKPHTHCLHSVGARLLLYFLTQDFWFISSLFAGPKGNTGERSFTRYPRLCR